MFCQNCGKKLKRGAKFCEFCGASTDGKKPAPAPTPVVDIKPEPVPEPVVEVKPEPIPEPVVEVKPEPIPEPVVEVKPEPAPQPAVQPQPVVQPQPSVQNKKKKSKAPLIITLVLVLLLAIGAGAFWFLKFRPTTDYVAEVKDWKPYKTEAVLDNTVVLDYTVGEVFDELFPEAVWTTEKSGKDNVVSIKGEFEDLTGSDKTLVIKIKVLNADNGNLKFSPFSLEVYGTDDNAEDSVFAEITPNNFLKGAFLVYGSDLGAALIPDAVVVMEDLSYKHYTDAAIGFEMSFPSNWDLNFSDGINDDLMCINGRPCYDGIARVILNMADGYSGNVDDAFNESHYVENEAYGEIYRDYYFKNGKHVYLLRFEVSSYLADLYKPLMSEMQSTVMVNEVYIDVLAQFADGSANGTYYYDDGYDYLSLSIYEKEDNNGVAGIMTDGWNNWSLYLCDEGYEIDGADATFAVYNSWGRMFLIALRKRNGVYSLEEYDSSKRLLATYTKTGDNMANTEDYIIPDSDTRLLTEDDLRSLSDWELKVARNEIYARHGRMFASQELQDYFNSKSWYRGFIAPEAFDESYLSEIEKKNAELIKQVEARRQH